MNIIIQIVKVRVVALVLLLIFGIITLRLKPVLCRFGKVAIAVLPAMVLSVWLMTMNSLLVRSFFTGVNRINPIDGAIYY